MENNSKVIDLVVSNDLCIGCGLCTYTCSNKSLQMSTNNFGFYVPQQIGNCDCDGSCLNVCPFNPKPDAKIKSENELANIFLKDTELSHPRIGKYKGTFIGYSNDYRLSSSSGGMATFILSELIERGIVDHVFSVSGGESGKHYEYNIASNKTDLLNSSKTRYYPVTLSNVFSKIDEIEGKVAVVGVGCFIKAIRLAQYADNQLKIKIPFLVGIICGGVKSSFFTDYVSSTIGMENNNYKNPEYRIKDYHSSAGDYSFSSTSKVDNKKKSIKMKKMGDMWGSGLFKANACDFCDDVTTELADISLGDAWLDPYDKDGKGTSVILTRSNISHQIIIEGIKNKKLNVDPLSLEKFLYSQRGSFSHRQDSIHYRIKKAKRMTPPKRIIDNKPITLDFKIVQFFRMITRKKSLTIWSNHPTHKIFDRKMKGFMFSLKIATLIYHFKRSLDNGNLLIKIKNKLWEKH